MFKQDVPLLNFFKNYHYDINEIGDILKHFIKGEIKVNLPNTFDELMKINSVEIPVKISGDCNSAELEYIKNPNYNESSYCSITGHNLIRIFEEAQNGEPIRRIIKISDKNRYVKTIIQILEYGQADDLYFTKIEYRGKSNTYSNIGSLTTIHFNSETFNYFRGQETNFDIFEDLDKVGIGYDDHKIIYGVQQSADNSVKDIDLILAKYDKIDWNCVENAKKLGLLPDDEDTYKVKFKSYEELFSNQESIMKKSVRTLKGIDIISFLLRKYYYFDRI